MDVGTFAIDKKSKKNILWGHPKHCGVIRSAELGQNLKNSQKYLPKYQFAG